MAKVKAISSCEKSTMKIIVDYCTTTNKWKSARCKSTSLLSLIVHSVHDASLNELLGWKNLGEISRVFHAGPKDNISTSANVASIECHSGHGTSLFQRVMRKLCDENSHTFPTRQWVKIDTSVNRHPYLVWCFIRVMGQVKRTSSWEKSIESR